MTMEGEKMFISKLDEHFIHVPIIKNVNKSDLEFLRKWIKTQPHLPFMSDRQISIFLHSCYGSLELCKRTIEAYYTKRTELTEMFSNRKIEELKAYLNVIFMFKGSNFSIDKYQVMYVGLKDYDSSKFNVISNVKTFFALMDLYTNLIPYASGWRLVIDAKGLNLGHYLKLSTSLSVSRKAVYYLQDALPVRLKGVHIRNANPFVSHFLALLKPFMKKELFEMIHVHSVSDETFYDYIAKEEIPNAHDDRECGELSENCSQESINLLEKYEKWLDDDELLARTDESKRLNRRERRTSYLRALIGRSD